MNTPNALEKWIQSHPWNTADDVMNTLQDAGIISDEAVTASDVATSDQQAAIEFLETGSAKNRAE